MTHRCMAHPVGAAPEGIAEDALFSRKFKHLFHAVFKALTEQLTRVPIQVLLLVTMIRVTIWDVLIKCFFGERSTVWHGEWLAV